MACIRPMLSVLKRRGHVTSWLVGCPVVTAAGSAPNVKSWWRRLLSSGSDDVVRSVKDVAEYLKDRPSCKVVVMAGAGISTASGIPDFRSPETGLYSNLHKYNLPYPEAVFDIDYFFRDPKPFYTLAKELYPWGEYRPNAVHYFVRLLYEKKLLHRMYTQNIDCLERMAGIPADKLVEAHGSFATATCKVCFKSYEGKDIENAIRLGEIPRCTRKLCSGVIKPDIVFFGEMLPKRFYLFTTDMPQADLLIVMGTSLEVEPFASIAGDVLPGVPRILFNLQASGPFAYSPRANDVVAEGDLIEQIWKFVELVGWKSELEQLIAECEKPKRDGTPPGG